MQENLRSKREEMNINFVTLLPLKLGIFVRTSKSNNKKKNSALYQRLIPQTAAR